MRKADVVILHMAAPAIGRRWLGQESEARAENIDPFHATTLDEMISALKKKGDFNNFAEQQFNIAIADSNLLDPRLLQAANTELATLMQRTVIGNQALTDEFSAVKEKISGSGNDQTQSLLDMNYQISIEVAHMQLHSHYYREAKQTLAKAIKAKHWTPEVAAENDPRYSMLATDIATGLPENEKGQIAYRDENVRSQREQFLGLIGFVAGTMLFPKLAPELLAQSGTAKVVASSALATTAAGAANLTMPGERDSPAAAAMNGLLAPLTIYGVMQAGAALADGTAIARAEAIYGNSINKELLVKRIANDIGGGKLTIGQLYDFAATKHLSPDVIGLRPPTGDLDALDNWRKTPLFENDQLVDQGSELLTGNSSGLNRIATVMFSPPAKIEPVQPAENARNLVERAAGYVPGKASSVGKGALQIGLETVKGTINTIRSGAGFRRIDVINDSHSVIANGLRWRAAYAAPFEGTYSAFPETPVLQKLSKEVSGKDTLAGADLTLEQLNAAAAKAHIGSRQLLRRDLLDVNGDQVTDDTYLFKNGERQQFFVKNMQGEKTVARKRCAAADD